MKKLLKKIGAFMRMLYEKIKDETKEHIPTAIKVVEALKKVMDSKVDDIIISTLDVLIPNLPTTQVEKVKAKIEEYLPKLLLELNLVNNIANTDDINKQLQMVLDTLKLSNDDVKAEKYHILASKILVILSDGKITWGEAVMFTEWYYQTYIKE